MRRAMVLEDEYLHPFERLFAGFADVDAEVGDGGAAGAIQLTAIKLDLPIELTIGVTDMGSVAMAAAPPTQHVRTSYMPVFHRIRISVVAAEDVDADG
jgi:hypothetical protein